MSANPRKEQKAKWRDYLKNPPAAPQMRIGLAGTFTLDPLEPLLGGALLDKGIFPAFSMGPFNQLHQMCMDPDGFFSAQQPLDAIIVYWRMEELLEPELLGLEQGVSAEAAAGKAQIKIAEFANALAMLRDRFAGILIVNDPPLPETVSIKLDDLHYGPVIGNFYRQTSACWQESKTQIKDLICLDSAGLEARVGVDNAKDLRKWYLYKQPYTELFFDEAARVLARILVAKTGTPKKCIALDCDGTLWGGIIGEDGLGGIALGDEFPGKAYRDLQRLIVSLYHQGIFITLLSKNNEPDAWEVFDRHDSMILERKHIAAWKIDWNPKAKNIVSLADTLNIGLDSFVFVDDNPFEIEQMKAAHPEVECVLLPDEPAYLVQTIEQKHLFDRLEITREDQKRTQMIQQEQQRSELKETMTPEEFLSSLDLKVDFFTAGSEHLSRVTQLINKTNQFNLTTIRRTSEQIEALGDSYEVFAGKVYDKFGEYGLTCVAIVKKETKHWEIDTFLLSCRVLGRKVETAVLAGIARRAAAAGLETIRAKFLPTEKNRPAAEFLPSHGFIQNNDQYYYANIESIINIPEHIQLIEL